MYGTRVQELGKLRHVQGWEERRWDETGVESFAGYKVVWGMVRAGRMAGGVTVVVVRAGGSVDVISLPHPNTMLEAGGRAEVAILVEPPQQRNSKLGSSEVEGRTLHRSIQKMESSTVVEEPVHLVVAA